MASAWIKHRTLASGATRYEVRFRIGGRESTGRYGGRFRTMREAKLRRDAIVGELAALRVPDLRAVDTSPVTFAAAAERWRSSRRDVAAGTAHTYQVALRRLLPRIGERPLDELTPAAWNAFIETLAASLKRESLRKTLSVAAMVFDHEAIEPNPVRSPLVKLPRGTKRIVEPPTAAHVLAVHRLLPAAYKLALVVLESTGMRVGELERLAWGDMDEPRGRWRVAVGKTDAATRWVSPPPAVLAAVLELVPRDDRTSERRVFQGFGGDRFRTALARAARAAGVPTFSPHDLRHRKVSMLHAGGVSWARIGEQVGHGDLVTTARTYTHVVADEAEFDYEEALR